MTKYEPLRYWLEAQPGTRVSISFDDIEDHDRIGVELPRAAREYRAWWGNENGPNAHTQAMSWYRAGWKVEEVDLDREMVTFAREPQLPGPWTTLRQRNLLGTKTKS